MGTSVKPIMFFDVNIKIKPHTASHAADVGRTITIQEFAQGMPVALYQDESGEYYAERRGGDMGERNVEAFIHGPEV